MPKNSSSNSSSNSSLDSSTNSRLAKNFISISTTGPTSGQNPSSFSFLDFRDLQKQEILGLFEKAHELKTTESSFQERLKGSPAALLFFEPSTRTRFSFESAAARLGMYPMVLSGQEGTSLEKGETYEDTVYNIAAMQPEILIIRCNDDLDLEGIQQNLPMPVLNAGWGKRGHPSQTMLDAFTIWEEFKTLSSCKILFVGDIKHSRVVSSHLELAHILGYEVGVCGPSDFLPGERDLAGVKFFSDLESGIKWCDVAMALRVQKERHIGLHSEIFDEQSYHQQFGLRPANLHSLKADGLILHPGPINYGVEMDHKVLADPRSRILTQVTNGVFIRQALILRSLQKKGRL